MATTPTGLAVLDDCTGGGQPASLWVLSGPTGVGVSDLTLGFARAAAIQAQQSVAWLSTSEEPEAVRRRALAAQSRTPIDLLDSEDPTGRVAEAEFALRAARLEITQVEPSALLHEAQETVEGGCDLLVLDSLDAPSDGGGLGYLKRLASDGPSWVVAVAADHGPDRLTFWRCLNGLADVLIWIERDDVLDQTTPRVGEADLLVMRPDRRTVTLTVAYQPTYRRFVGVAAP